MRAFVITMTIVHGLNIWGQLDNALKPEKNTRDVAQTVRAGIIGSVVATAIFVWGLSVLGWV